MRLQPVQMQRWAAAAGTVCAYLQWQLHDRSSCCCCSALTVSSCLVLAPPTFPAPKNPVMSVTGTGGFAPCSPTSAAGCSEVGPADTACVTGWRGQDRHQPCILFAYRSSPSSRGNASGRSSSEALIPAVCESTDKQYEGACIKLLIECEIFKL